MNSIMSIKDIARNWNVDGTTEDYALSKEDQTLVDFEDNFIVEIKNGNTWKWLETEDWFSMAIKDNKTLGDIVLDYNTIEDILRTVANKRGRYYYGRYHIMDCPVKVYSTFRIVPFKTPKRRI
jgi:hypothetical protein